MRRREKIAGMFSIAALLVCSAGIGFSNEMRASNNPAPVLVDNFEDGNMSSALGSHWTIFNDNHMGGKSVISASVVNGGAKGSKKSLKLTGKVTTDFQYGGFAGIRAMFDEGGTPRDMTSYTGIQFYARGDGRKYRVEVMTAAVKDFNEYGKEFESTAAWKLYQFPFSQLAQSPYFGRKVKWTGTDVRGVVFITSGFPIESYTLQVDDVTFY